MNKGLWGGRREKRGKWSWLRFLRWTEKLWSSMIICYQMARHWPKRCCAVASPAQVLEDICVLSLSTFRCYSLNCFAVKALTVFVVHTPNEMQAASTCLISLLVPPTMAFYTWGTCISRQIFRQGMSSKYITHLQSIPFLPLRTGHEEAACLLGYIFDINPGIQNSVSSYWLGIEYNGWDSHFQG